MKKRNPLLRLAARVVIACLGISVLAGSIICCEQQPARQITLTIFHTNDIHARIDNLAKIAWIVKEERKTNANAFFVNAGDNFSGNPIVDQYVPRGEPMQVLMNLMGYNVLELGNHEFDYGQEILGDFMRKANFHILCANVKIPDQAVLPQPKPYVILETEEGIRAAFLGLVQIEGRSRIPSTHPAKIQGLAFSDGIETARHYRYLKDKCHVFIALSHLGYETDEILAQGMGELDIIIGGHSHTLIENPVEINHVLITQAGDNGRYLGRIDITLKNGRIITKKAGVIEVASIKEEIPEIKKKVNDYNNNPLLDRLVTTLPGPVAGEPVLGNLITDAVRKVLHLDMAFHNSGGIRSSKLERAVRLKDIYTLLPFGNYVIQFQMSPAEIRTLMKNDFERRKHLDLYVSGITYTVVLTAKHRVKDVELRDARGRFLDENKTYKVGISDYVASAYPFTHQDDGQSLGVTFADTLIQYLEQGGHVTRHIKEIRTYTKILLAALPLMAGPSQQVEKGKIIEKVICKDDAQESYALYVPTAYSNEKKWPILYAFDPGAVTKIPLELFKAAAERYHYIVICPFNVKNGPWEPIIKAMKAVWQDSRRRFSLDYSRIYTAGFSGGARAAALFPHIIGVPAAGIIACGAGLPQGITPEQVKPAYYHGIVGLEDFNYKEFAALGRQLDQAMVAHTIEVIEGPHQWPPEGVCSRAVEWLEILAMKNGTRPKDDSLVDEIYHNTLGRGQSLEAAGMIFHAVSFYQHAAALFNGLKDTAELEKKITRFQAAREYQQFTSEENRRNIKEREFIHRFAFVFSLIRNSDPAGMKLKKILNDLQIDSLLKEAEQNKDVYDRAMARRLLIEILIKGAREGAAYLKKGDCQRAVLFLEIVAEAGTQNFNNYYNLACAYALAKDKKKALRNLQLAIDKGFNDASLLEKDVQLAPLRKEKEFQQLLQSLKQKEQ